MSGSMLMDRRPTTSEEAADAGTSLWEIKRARALESVLHATHQEHIDDDLAADFAFFAEDTAAWAESALPLANEAWGQD